MRTIGARVADARSRMDSVPAASAAVRASWTPASVNGTSPRWSAARRSGSVSTSSTSWPIAANPTALTRPTYPAPTTAIDRRDVARGSTIRPSVARDDAPSDGAHGAHRRPAQWDRRRAAASGRAPVGAQGMAPDGEHVPRSTRDRGAAGRCRPAAADLGRDGGPQRRGRAASGARQHRRPDVPRGRGRRDGRRVHRRIARHPAQLWRADRPLGDGPGHGGVQRLEQGARPRHR